MRRLFGVFVFFLLFSAFGGTLYYLYANSEEPEVVFDTVLAKQTDIVVKTVATGSVVPRKEVAIKPAVSGILASILVEPGDVVKQGDLIARVSIIPDMVTLANADNRLNRARINMDDARTELARLQQLHREGVIADTEFRAAQLTHTHAEEELSAAQDNLALIRKGSTPRAEGESNTLVRATASGMVLEVPLEEGDSVIEANTFNEGTTIATVADMEELIFEGKVDESEVGKLQVGMELVLTIGAIEDVRLTATLEHIAPKGIEENGAIQFQIRAALQLQHDVFVRANYSANADIVLERRENVLAIDEGLLHFDGDATYVEVETAPQQFERRDVQTGLSDGIHVEVLGGLAQTDRLKKA